MYARVLTFSGVNDLDAGLKYIRDTALGVVASQRGYRGLTASADRAGGVLGVLSLWEREADRDASESALGKTREEGRSMLGGKLTVAMYEERVVEMSKPPTIGSSLMVTRISMNPAVVDENIEFFRREILPRIKSTPGFRAVRNMVDPKTGDGLVGTIWDDEKTLKAAAEEAMARRPEAVGRGVTFGDTSYREVVLIDMK